MNSTVLNRDFQHPTDGWYMIEPTGEHPNETAHKVQVIDNAARQSIVNRFNADAKAGKLSHGSEMLIDSEHFKHYPDKPTTAYGWGYQLENRSDGIYAKIRWTNTGQKAVDGGDYRFFSTEYDPADLEPINGSESRVRPMRLAGLTLTNQPNNKGGTPITNRGVMDKVKREADVKADFERNLGPGKHSAPALPLSATEQQWCGAVKGFMDAARTRGHVMTVASAWSEAQARFPKLYDAAFNSDQTPPTRNRFNSSFDTKAEHEAAKQENLRHIQANKDAAAQVEAQRNADSEGEAKELAVTALEKFCRAVKSVMDSTGRTGHQMMDMPSAWTYAKQKFPDLYPAAFAPDTEDDSDDVDAAQAASIAKNVANRISKLTGKGFEFGWNFARHELPNVFNRMTPARAGGRIMNRVERRVAQINTPNAAKIFNRLVRAESAISRLPDSQALMVIAERHPGLYGLASGRMLASDALRTDPSVADLLT